MSSWKRFTRFAAIALLAAGCSGDDLGSEGDTCGGDLADCADNLYCNYIDDACGSAAPTGVCTVRPPGMCTLELNPVLGCDGEDYGNPCAAYQAGTDVNRPEVRAAGGST